MDYPAGGSSDVKKFKVVLLGEGAVGKTSLVLRYVENKFSTRHVSTVQAAFMAKKLNLNGERLELLVWDTAGQERFHALGPIYYRGSHGAVLVYDITDEDSFVRVKNWVKELRKMLGETVMICIAGNKVDLEKDRHVPEADAKLFAESVGASHYNTSAKTNQGVEEMFLSLSKRMLQHHNATSNRSASSPSGDSRGATNNRSILVVDSTAVGDDNAGFDDNGGLKKCSC